MRLLAAFVNDYSVKVASVLRRPLRRLAGDMAVLGKGEYSAVNDLNFDRQRSFLACHTNVSENDHEGLIELIVTVCALSQPNSM